MATAVPVGNPLAQAGYGAGSGLAVNSTNLDNTLITGLAGGQTVKGGTAASETLTFTSTAHATTKGTIDIGALPMLHFQEDIASSGGDYVNFRIGKSGGGFRESFSLNSRGGSLGDDVGIGFNPAGGAVNVNSASANRIRCSLLSGSEYQLILQPGNSGATPTTVFTASGLNKVCTFAGGVRYPWNAQTATSYTVLQSDYFISADTTAGATIYTLPSAVTAGAGATFEIKRITAGGNGLTIKATAGTIDGTAAATGVSMATQYQWRRFTSDGANWNVTGSYL